MLVSIIFWLSLAGILYTYAGYPLLLAALARCFPRPVRKEPVTLSYSVLFAVHNEAARLPIKLKSLLSARGTENLLEILIGSDGSTDDPVAAAASTGDPRVKVIAFPQSRGKPAVLNDLMAQARGDIVVLMDARQEADPGVFDALLPNFADARVGVVSGELVFRSPATATGQGMDTYWRYEKFLRRNEGRFRSVPGATGAVYAIRRSLLHPIPPETLVDDMAIPLQAVRAGYRCIFEGGAVVYDDPSQRLDQESARKRRTLAGNIQMVQMFPWLLHPIRNPIWFEFVSHKLMRLAVPLLMIVALAGNLWLVGEPLYNILLAAQLAFYALAAAGALAAALGRRGGLLAVPYLFVSLQAVTLLALWDAARGRYQVRWTRTT